MSVNEDGVSDETGLPLSGPLPEAVYCDHASGCGKLSTGECAECGEQRCGDHALIESETAPYPYGTVELICETCDAKRQRSQEAAWERAQMET